MKDYVLLVVDYQDKLFSKISNRDMVLRRARLMIRFAREMEIPILWTEHYPKGLGSTVPEVAGLLEGVERIEKRSFSCFGEEEFQRRIREVAEKNAEDGGLRWPNVIITGIETHICIEQTAFDSAKMGFPTTVLADCVSSRNPIDHDTSLHRLRSLAAGTGLYSRPLPIEVTTSEALIYRILKRGEGETFKKVLSIIKEEGS